MKSSLPSPRSRMVPNPRRFDSVRFHFMSADEDDELVGSVLIRDSEMVLDIPRGGATPYLIVGQRTMTYYKGGNTQGSGFNAVQARWASVGDLYIGEWVEEGEDYLFSFPLPER